MSDEQTTVAVPPASEEQLLNEQKKKNGSLGSAGEATASWGIAKTAHRLICFFRQFPKSQDTVDAPLIMSAANYQEIAARCPQCFKPFVDFIEGLSAIAFKIMFCS